MFGAAIHQPRRIANGKGATFLVARWPGHAQVSAPMLTKEFYNRRQVYLASLFL